MTRTLSMSLNEWNVMYKEIYYVNQNYYHGIHEILNRLIEVVSVFGRSITKKPFNESNLTEFLPKSFAWFFALVQKLGVKDVESLLWKKYPYCCPYCLNASCSCESPRGIIDLEKLGAKEKENQSLQPRNFDGWQEMLNKIYGSKNSEMEPATLMGKFYEEFGELSEAIRLWEKDKTNTNWQNELADIFAWLVAGTNFVNKKLEGQISPLKISEITFKKYPNCCSRCNKLPCECQTDLAILRVSEAGPFQSEAQRNCVFIVHGKDHTTRDEVNSFLTEELKMDTIVLENKPNAGRTIISKFIEESARAFSAIIILTPDDELKDGEKSLKLARQNVMFEMGYFFSQLGNRRVILLHHKDVYIPGNLLGIAYIGFEKIDGGVKDQIYTEFKEMGSIIREGQ